MTNIDKSKFTHIGKNIAQAEAITRPTVSYYQDAWRRLKKHKLAMVSIVILTILITMSLIGPVISNILFDHTYDKQDLTLQNQVSWMNNKRAIKLKKNNVLKYSKYEQLERKTKTVFHNVTFKGTGQFLLVVGNPREEAYQGDKNEYTLDINVMHEGIDNLVGALQKVNDDILKKDPAYRGLNIEYNGKDLILTSVGETWFNGKYWFGTDEFGRDLFTRCWEGGRLSFLIAFLSVFLTVIVGVVYGGISGYLGGKVDMIMMRIVEILIIIPSLLYIILLLTVMNPGVWPIIIVIGATGWMTTARIVRGEVLRLKHSEYVLASEVLGADSKRVIMKHLIPNAMGPIIVNSTMMIPVMIFVEAFLSYIGLGVPAPYASWGSLINDGAKIFTQHPNQLLVPGIALSLTMLGFNLLGDGLRDALDPKLRK